MLFFLKQINLATKRIAWGWGHSAELIFEYNKCSQCQTNRKQRVDQPQGLALGLVPIPNIHECATGRIFVDEKFLSGQVDERYWTAFKTSRQHWRDPNGDIRLVALQVGLKAMDIKLKKMRAKKNCWSFYPQLFFANYQLCYEYPTQLRYSIAFAMICSHFTNCTHELCPEEVNIPSIYIEPNSFDLKFYNPRSETVCWRKSPW